MLEKYDINGWITEKKDSLGVNSTEVELPLVPLPSGFDWRFVSGAWVQEERLNPSVFVDPNLLDTIKARAIKTLHDKADQEYSQYLANYPKNEVSTFDKKSDEALAWCEDNSALTPFIDSLSKSDSVLKEELILAILAKVDYLAEKETAVVVTRDAIKACTTVEELENIKL